MPTAHRSFSSEGTHDNIYIIGKVSSNITTLSIRSKQRWQIPGTQIYIPGIPNFPWEFPKIPSFPNEIPWNSECLLRKIIINNYIFNSFLLFLFSYSFLMIWWKLFNLKVNNFYFWLNFNLANSLKYILH